MLSDFDVQPMLPVKDLEVAKIFYERTLGLEKVDELPSVVVSYRSGKTRLCVDRSEFAGTNKGTAALCEVKDVETTVKSLKSNGEKSEHYDDMPGLSREGKIHFAGDLRVAWLKDPDRNILSVQNRVPRPPH